MFNITVTITASERLLIVLERLADLRDDAKIAAAIARMNKSSSELAGQVAAHPDPDNTD